MLLISIIYYKNINLKNLTIKRDKLNSIIGEYITENSFTKNQQTPVINKVIKVLQKRK